MRRFFVYSFLAMFLFGCAATDLKKAQNSETRTFSSAFYAAELTTSDGWQNVSMIDSDDGNYMLQRENGVKGILLKGGGITMHIKGNFALFQDKNGQMVVLEEAK